MTWRIRAYLAVMAFRYIGSGAALLRSESAFTESPHFRYVFDMAALEVWAAVFFIVGGLALAGVARPRLTGIRATLIVSVGVTTLWAAAFFSAEVLDGTRAALGTVFFTALAAKDLIVSSMPLAVPLEVESLKRKREG